MDYIVMLVVLSSCLTAASVGYMLQSLFDADEDGGRRHPGPSNRNARAPANHQQL